MIVLTSGSYLLVERTHLQVVLTEASVIHFDGGVEHVVRLLLHHVVLLRAEDGPRSGNSCPPNEGFSWYLIMLHTVQTDEGAGTPEACFTMHCNGACFRIGKVILAGAQKLLDDVGRRSGTVHKYHVIMSDASLLKLSLIILGLVQSYDSRNFQMLKYFGVAGGRMAVPRLLALVTVNWSHKGDELAGDNPVEITIFNFFVMFILSGIELIEVVPLLFESKLKTLQAVINCAFVGAFSFTSITEGKQDLVVLTETLIGFICSHFKDNEHESTH